MGTSVLTTEKVCPGCGRSKSFNDFHRKRASRDGLQSYCKPCQLVRARAAPSRAARESRICVDCNAVINVRKDKPTQMCGSCSRRVAGRSGGAARGEQMRKDAQARRAAHRARVFRVFIDCACAECGARFLVRGWSTGNGSARYCSTRCRNRFTGKGYGNRPEITQAQRRAVFERDRWICKLCGVPIAPWLRWPDLDCAVVDHIIPLAAGVEFGGVHAPHNWQTAHNRCNANKADAWSQGALF